MAKTSVKKQVSNIAKKAQQIQSTFNRDKGKYSAADRAKIGAGLTKATQGVSSLVKSDVVARATGGRGSTGRDYATSAITSDSIKDSRSIDLPGSKVTPVGDIAANNVGLAGGDSSLTNNGGVLTQEAAPAVDDKYAGATAIYNKYVTDIQQAGADRTTGADIQRKLEKDTGIKKLRQTENDLSAQINTIIANRDAAKLSLEGQGRGQTSSFVGGEQARMDREAAIKALPVQALLAQAQGNVALAEAHINTWGSILMNDANNEYTQRKELLTSAKDFAIGIEGKRIDDLNAANERKYQETQALISAKTQALANAMGQEAPQSVVSAIQGATTLEGVVAATGKYNADLLGREAQKASIANSYSQISSRNLADKLALAEAGNAAAIAELGLTANDGSTYSSDEVAFAQQYAATGQIPAGLQASGVSFGRIAEMAKDLPKPTGTMVNAANGVKDTTIPAAEQDDLKRLYNIIQLTNRLKELDKKRVGGVVPGLLGKALGSDAQGEYITVRQNIIDEITRMQTGAALTESEQKFYGDYLPGRFSEPLFLGRDSEEVIKDFGSVMESRLENSLANNQLSIYGYSKVKLGETEYKVGEIIENANGQKGIVQPDGNITLIQ